MLLESRPESCPSGFDCQHSDEGLLGNKYVEVSFGSPDGMPIQPGDQIRTQPPLDISDLMDKANVILDSTKEATDNVAQISAKINRGEVRWERWSTTGSFMRMCTRRPNSKAGRNRI
jgi:hypothetical protein